MPGSASTSGLAPSQLAQQQITIQQPTVARILEERIHVGDDGRPVERLDSMPDHRPPVLCSDLLTSPTRLVERVLQEDEVGRRAFRTCQIPGEVEEISSLGPAPGQYRVDLAGHAGVQIVDTEADGEMPRHEAGLQNGAGRRTRVDLDPDHQLRAPLGSEAGLLEEAGKSDLRGPDSFLVPDRRLDRVAGLRQVAPGLLGQSDEAAIAFRFFQGKVEIFGESSQSIQEPKGCPALKGEGREGPRVLQRSKDVRLKILTDEIEPSAPIRLCDRDLEEVFLHRAPSASAPSQRRRTVRAAARMSRGLAVLFAASWSFAGSSCPEESRSSSRSRRPIFPRVKWKRSSSAFSGDAT